MASYSIASYSATTVKIQVSGLSSGNSVRYFIRLTSGTTAVHDSTYTATGSTLTKEFTGLQPSTSYTINVQVNGTWLGAKTFATSSASYTITDRTSTTAWVTVSGLASGVSVWFYVRLSSGSTVAYDQTFTATGSTLTKNISGLQPSTSYTINVRVDGTWLGAKTFTTMAAKVRPNDWAWWSTVVQGGKIGLSAAEWNRFCTVINEFRIYKDLSSYSFTTVYSGDKISASIVNQARSAISSIPGHGTLPSNVSPGSLITAYYFNQLKNALNAIT